ncbi:hypothetical protein [Nitrosomonas ureae]|uniref:Uncharacterized protein n=1 Tax=Nitrosomonas ureae TaxID=44577 RepID=A0A1H5XVG8_9PROT|nr:hypothetical protein [Nitrosomonas ureae]SEG15744.1 hypothetical protein SAMN05216334_13233 [Nitrosomonas ureae]
MITLSLDVYESKNYANLYRAWYRLNRFYLSKKSANARTKYFFVICDSNYKSDFSSLFSAARWFRYCAHFRDFCLHLSKKGFGLASLYVQVKKDFRFAVVYWQFYSETLDDIELIARIRTSFSQYSAVPFPEKQRKRALYADMLLHSVDKGC